MSERVRKDTWLIAGILQFHALFLCLVMLLLTCHVVTSDLVACKLTLYGFAGLNMSSLAAMFGGGGEAGGFGGLGGGAPPVEDPETAYASQLTQLQASYG